MCAAMLVRLTYDSSLSQWSCARAQSPPFSAFVPLLGVAVLLRLRLQKGGGWNEQKNSDLYFYPEKRLARGSLERKRKVCLHYCSNYLVLVFFFSLSSECLFTFLKPVFASIKIILTVKKKVVRTVGISKRFHSVLGAFFSLSPQ